LADEREGAVDASDSSGTAAVVVWAFWNRVEVRTYADRDGTATGGTVAAFTGTGTTRGGGKAPAACFGEGGVYDVIGVVVVVVGCCCGSGTGALGVGVDAAPAPNRKAGAFVAVAVPDEG